MEKDSDSSSLSLLLSILRDRKPRSPITSVINASTIELTRKLLFTRDFVNLSSDLSDASDVKHLMDFMLYLLRSGHLSNTDVNPDSGRRARRMMFRIMTRTPVMPKSLFVTGVSMKAHREYIDGGGFGVVFKGKLKGAPVALKVLYRAHNNIDFCREAFMWRSLNHKFVLPFLGIYENEATSQLFIVSPYMTNGPLSQWRKKTNRSAVEILDRMTEVVQGLQYIHSEGVAHGDLRGDNVLLDDNFHVQIADFGLTRHSDSSVTQSGAALHYNSAAPELFEDYPSDNADDTQSLERGQKADIYAFGCLYYEIHFDIIPFAGIKDIQIVKRVSRGERPPRLNKPPLSDEAWKLIHRCWVKEPSKRPTMKDIANRMRAWRSTTPDAAQNSASQTLQSHDPWSRLDQFGTIAKHPINEMPFNGTSLLDGSSSFLTTKLLVGFNPGNVSTTPPLHSRARTPPVTRTPSITEKKGKITIAIDFGTAFSGVAYTLSRVSEGRIEQGFLETLREIPTCLLYDWKGRVLAWGLEAKSAGQIHGSVRCEWFKRFMEPRNLHDEASTRSPSLPPRKQAFDLIVDYLERLWEYAKYQIVRQAGIAVDLNYADIWLTVPATWDKEGRKIMREAAIAAGLIQKERNSDHRWRDRLHIITEDEAAAAYCCLHADINRLRLSQNFMIVDAGGGSCTFSVYKVIGETGNLEIAELCKRSSSDCGSIFIDMRFRGLVQMLLSDHPAHLDSASLAYFVHSFETEKLTYLGHDDDATMFYFTCFNREDPNDPSVGLINGHLCIPGKLLRNMVFDPVINQILTLIEQQIERMTESIDALVLAGGAGGEYLKRCIETRFGSKIATISRPADAGTATLRGAVECGLSEKQFVSSIMAPRSYMINEKLPAEREDVLRRPEYVMNNYGNIAICENRVRYLLEKGTILRKGQRSISTFRKFSKNALDCTFVVTVFASEEDKVMRYADEGKITERRKWEIDLSSLPAFKQNASIYQSGGFYTDFEVGLEIDKTEVRGVLLHDNQEWGWQWTTIDDI